MNRGGTGRGGGLGGAMGGVKRRRWAFGGVAVAVLVAAADAPVYAKSCASDADYAALSLRVLQSDLLVAGLRCRKPAMYGSFVTKFRGELQSNGGVLKKFFESRGGTRNLDLMVTRLANDASNRTGVDTHGYCAEVGGLFDEVLAIEKGGLKNYAIGRPQASAHGFKRCSSSPLKLVSAEVKTPSKAMQKPPRKPAVVE
jgi:hypothetical protein